MIIQTLAQSATTTVEGVSLRDLFMQSFDVFTVLLVGGSLLAGTVIVRCALEIRESAILPPDSVVQLRRLIKDARHNELRTFAERDDSMPSKVLLAALRCPSGDAPSMREAAELAAGEESARWFRKIEPLNILGNMGPLLGLAGTVWGMILAFSSLGQAGGQASPAILSAGIAKALFHTLLGLMLAVPALSVFGFYRSRVDRACTRAMVVSAELLDELIASHQGTSEDIAPPPGSTRPMKTKV